MVEFFDPASYLPGAPVPGDIANEGRNVTTTEKLDWTEGGRDLRTEKGQSGKGGGAPSVTSAAVSVDASLISADVDALTDAVTGEGVTREAVKKELEIYVTGFVTEKGRWEAEKTDLENAYNKANKDIEKLRQQIDNLQNQIEEKESELGEHNDAITRLTAEAGLQKQLKEEASEMAKFEGTVSMTQ